MASLRRSYRLTDSDDELLYVVECLFSVTRGEALAEFLTTWQLVAEFCEWRRYFIHEGYAIALAARLSGFPISQDGFAWLPGFFKYRQDYQDVEAFLSLPEFEAMKQEIDGRKGAQPWGRVSVAKRRVRTLLRWSFVLAAGLHLMD